MSGELRFFLLLIEKYACDRDRPTAEVMREWDEKNVTREIYEGYWQYHQEPLQNAYADIDSLTDTGRHKVYD